MSSLIPLTNAYAHCGLKKYLPIEQVRQAADHAQIERTVLVQHLGEYDNSYIQGIVEAEPDRFAGCFTIDTSAPDAEETLKRWADTQAFRGIRLLAETLVAAPRLWDLAAQRRLNIVTYQEPTLALYAGPLASFLESQPDAKLILSHFGVLVSSESPCFESFDRILELARFPNAYLQLSGMHMYSSFPYDDIQPLVFKAIDAFTPKRLLYGANFPPANSVELFYKEAELARSGKLGIPEVHRAQILCHTADALWFD